MNQSQSKKFNQSSMSSIFKPFHLFIIFLSIYCIYAKHIYPDDPNFSYSGRIDYSNPKELKFDWSNIEISTSFTGKCLSVLLNDSGENGFNIFIDNELHVLFPTKNRIRYDITCSLQNKLHRLLITKRTEALFGVTGFLGIMIDDDAKVEPIREKKMRKIEFYGDSYTAGYGNEGQNATCKFTKYTQNSYVTYAAMVARNLSAEYHIQPWSGKGMVRNYGAPNITSPDPLYIYINRTIANDPKSIWNFKWIPDLVFIFLGINDYSTQPHPPYEIFKEGYYKFVNFLISKYGPVPIYGICMTSSRPVCDYLKRLASEYKDHKIEVIVLNPLKSNEYGCGYHPNVLAHERMAQEILKKLSNKI